MARAEPQTETARAARTGRGRWWVLGAALVAHATSLTGPFQFDDAGVIVHDDAVHSWTSYWALAAHGLRPLLKLSYAANWTLGAGPLGFHVVNVLVHLLCVELVMRLCAMAADRALRSPWSPWWRGAASTSARGGALVAGALFALHPIQTEAVTYISGRSSSLSTCFVLIACLLYAQAARAERGHAWRPLLFSLLAFLCAVAVKETMAALPAALLLWELCIERSARRATLGRQAAYWGLLCGVLTLLLMHPAYFRLLYENTGTRPLADSVAYQVAGAGYLASRLVLVQRLCIDPGLFLEPPTQAQLAASSALLLAALAVALLQRDKRPSLAFGASWSVLHLLVPYVVVPRIDVINERHMYLANVGLFLAIGSLGHELWQRVRARSNARTTHALVLAAALGAGLLLSQTVRRNLDYATEITLWESTVRIAPENPRAHHNLGVAYERAGRWADARAAYRSALAREPRLDSARDRLQQLRYRH